MTLQPAPGAGIVQRDAHTIPPREPRDGRRIGTPISAEEPELIESRRPATAYLRARGLLSVPTTSVWPGRTDRVIVDWRPGPNYPAERIVR